MPSPRWPVWYAERAVRLDKLLHHLRFVKSRSLAQGWIGEGHMRHNGRRVVRLDAPVNVGDVLTLPLRESVLVVEILSLPARRGPPAEARECYRLLDAGVPIAIAGAEAHDGMGTHHRVGARHSEGKMPE